MLEIAKASPKESRGVSHSSAVWSLKQYPWVFIYKEDRARWAICSMTGRLPGRGQTPDWLKRLAGQGKRERVATFLLGERSFSSRQEAVEALTQARAEAEGDKPSSLGQIL